MSERSLRITVSRSTRSITKWTTTTLDRSALGAELEDEIDAVFQLILQFPLAAPPQNAKLQKSGRHFLQGDE